MPENIFETLEKELVDSIKFPEKKFLLSKEQVRELTNFRKGLLGSINKSIKDYSPIRKNLKIMIEEDRKEMRDKAVGGLTEINKFLELLEHFKEVGIPPTAKDVDLKEKEGCKE